ncbi:unnamed protein product [Acanthoscelides obtectus]|uniref:Uncharacterized protein n=1 Tax=Acanthoscelides obtectus TaxID=200917 RepID=A0A9P0LL90_ACAOB|nr:unnamed protein product [Acanthoscelides obtectus]CAK1676966.1 hypothetical protein AOBTE_LOCUS31034 [Acanthoscelides obtectus]
MTKRQDIQAEEAEMRN